LDYDNLHSNESAFQVVSWHKAVPDDCKIISRKHAVRLNKYSIEYKKSRGVIECEK